MLCLFKRSLNRLSSWVCMAVLTVLVGATGAFAADPTAMPDGTTLQAAIDTKIWTFSLIILGVLASLFAFGWLTGLLRRRK